MAGFSSYREYRTPCFLTLLADYKRSSWVPETSQYTLEQLHYVFSKDTSDIWRTGWAQVWWLIGSKERGFDRWELKKFPRLVPRVDNEHRNNFEQEIQETEMRGYSVNGGQENNGDAAPQASNSMNLRLRNARGE